MDAQRTFLDICARCEERRITLSESHTAMIKFKSDFSTIQNALKYVDEVLDHETSIEWVFTPIKSQWHPIWNLTSIYILLSNIPRVEIESLMLELYVHDRIDQNDFHVKLVLFFAFIYNLDTIEA